MCITNMIFEKKNVIERAVVGIFRKILKKILTRSSDGGHVQMNK